MIIQRLGIHFDPAGTSGVATPPAGEVAVPVSAPSTSAPEVAASKAAEIPRDLKGRFTKDAMNAAEKLFNWGAELPEDHMREVVGIPAPKKGEKTLSKAKSQPQGQPGGSPQKTEMAQSPVPKSQQQPMPQSPARQQQAAGALPQG